MTGFYTTEASLAHLAMGLHYDIFIERVQESYYIATVRQLPGIQMEGRSLDDLEIEIQEAIRISLGKRAAEGLDFTVRIG